MFNVFTIIRNNSTTFYDLYTRKPRSQKPRLFTASVIAFVAALLFSNVSESLLSGFLAVQSILLGFTFNVMFFLLGNREAEAESYKSLEAKLRAERLRELYKELFYNVAYFNLIAVLSIIVAALLLLPNPEIPKFMHGWYLVEVYARWLQTSIIPVFVQNLTNFGSMFVFYCLAIEVVYSVARVIGRTSFYFERKMREMQSQDIA